MSDAATVHPALLPHRHGQPKQTCGMDDDKNAFGVLDPKEKCGGWVTATDADSGAVRRKFREDRRVHTG